MDDRGDEIVITARVRYIRCPKCGEEVAGFVGDPRGGDGIVCEECGETFEVPSDARVSFD